MDDVIATIEEHRKLRCMTKQDLARRAYITPTSYTRYTKGKANPSIDTIRALMRAVGVNTIVISER